MQVELLYDLDQDTYNALIEKQKECIELKKKQLSEVTSVTYYELPWAFDLIPIGDRFFQCFWDYIIGRHGYTILVNFVKEIEVDEFLDLQKEVMQAAGEWVE